MKGIKKISLLIVFVCCLGNGMSFAQVQMTEFRFNKGINISAWLSQTGVKEGPEREAYFTEADLVQLAQLGFDHIRIPVDEKQMYREDGRRNDETFKLIHKAINWCRKANVRVIFDCHDLYVSRELKPKPNQLSLWESDTAQANFVRLWEKLSDELKQYPNDLLAYEILNEPVAPDPETWNKVSARAIAAIRKREPARVIFLGSNKFNSVTTFHLLKVPQNDPNIILSFHFYHPGILTHYNVASFEGGAGGGGVKLNYPGVLIPKDEIERLPEDQKQKIAVQQGTFNKEKLREKMMPPVELAKKLKLRVHCGEYGTNFKYPDTATLVRWITDLTSVMKEEKIPYTVWGYRKNFGVFGDDKKVKNQQYLEAVSK